MKEAFCQHMHALPHKRMN